MVNTLDIRMCDGGSSYLKVHQQRDRTIDELAWTWLRVLTDGSGGLRAAMCVGVTMSFCTYTPHTIMVKFLAVCQKLTLSIFEPRCAQCNIWNMLLLVKQSSDSSKKIEITNITMDKINMLSSLVRYTYTLKTYLPICTHVTLSWYLLIQLLSLVVICVY